MSIEEFEDNCEGCKPALLDVKTKRPYPADSPEVKAMMVVWEGTTREERVAYHNVCCNNSLDQKDMLAAQQVAMRIADALKQVIDVKEES